LNDEAGASADIDAAGEIQERLVDALGASCPPSYRRLLDAIREVRPERPLC
jgi:hypothetical protein